MPIAWRDSNLGVTMVYLQPIFPSAAYHGYQHGPADQLNSRFGTEAQFLAFVDAAHARGIKVILDFVAYGISQNSPYCASEYGSPSSTDDPWPAFTNAANNDGHSMQEPRGFTGSILETYRSLIAMRSNSVVLRRGSYLPVTYPNTRIYKFVRSDAAETVLVVINLNSRSAGSTINLSAFTVPATGTVPTSLENSTTLPVITTSNKGAYPVSLADRSWFIARAALSIPQVVTHPDIDGRTLPIDAGAAALRATHHLQTTSANSISSLRALTATRCACPSLATCQKMAPRLISLLVSIRARARLPRKISSATWRGTPGAAC